MKSIRSIVTGLLATIVLVLPLSQAHATFIHSYGSQQNNYGPGNQVQKKQEKNNYGPKNDKDELYKRIVRKELEKYPGLDGRRETKGDDDFKDNYSDGGKCDDDNNNVPEPTPLTLLGLGLGVIGLVRRFVPSRRS